MFEFDTISLGKHGCQCSSDQFLNLFLFELFTWLKECQAQKCLLDSKRCILVSPVVQSNFFFYGLAFGLSWWIFHMQLCSLQLLGSVFNVIYVRLVDIVFWYFYVPIVFLSTCYFNYWETDVEIFNCKYGFANLSLYSFSLINFCFIYFEVLFRMFKSSSWIDPFIIRDWPLSLVILLVLSIPWYS